MAIRTALASIALFASSGAAAGAKDPRPDPDACTLLSNLDLEPLLFGGTGGALDSWSNHPAPGMSTCTWQARPRDQASDAKPRVAALAFYHLADRAQAQAQLDRQPHGDDARPSLAIVGGGDDTVVRSGAAVIVARHGADLAVLDARGAELADPDRLEARYVLDALTLKAAGAKVKPPPWARPGQKAGWVPLATPSQDAVPERWTPPANPGASRSVLLDWLLRCTLLILQHPFAILFGAIFGGVAIAAIAKRPAPQTGRARSRLLWLTPATIAAAVANLIFGNAVADRLLHRFGVSAAATITGRYGTSTQYNNHNVVGYHVLLRTPQGKTASVDFQDDEFNVYPPHNATRYPDQGDIFTIRYLPTFPGDFTILADDESPWARSLRCAALSDAARQAAARAGFSHATEDRAGANRAQREADLAGRADAR